MIKIGVFSDAIGGGDPEEVAARARAAGVEAVQLRLDWPGLDLDGSAADRARVRRAYERAGVEIAALAAYTNLLDPDAGRRRANRRRFERAIGLAPELGARVVVTECGSYNPVDAWGDHPHNHTSEAWVELIKVTAHLAILCEREGVILAYEPYVNSVVDSAGAARTLADQIASDTILFVFDPAGLVTPASLPRNGRVTAEALEALRGRIALVHADDVRYEGGAARWLPLGWGDLDAGAVYEGLAGARFDGAIIVEHLPEALVPAAVATCRAGLDRARAARRATSDG